MASSPYSAGGHHRAQSQPQLQILSSKLLSAPAKPETLSYCPTMDLVAFATVEGAVEVYRLNGERVFSVAGGVEGGGIGAERVAWRADGKMLAIASCDAGGIIRLIDVWSGKVVHRLSTANAKLVSTETHPRATPKSTPTSSQQKKRGQPNVSCLAYVSCSTHPKPAKRRGRHESDREQDSDDLSDMEDSTNITNKRGTKTRVRPDLPKELGMLDVEISLPKLSALPGTGGDDDIFSTRASIDAIFHSGQQHQHGHGGVAHSKTSSRGVGETIDVLLAGFDDGTIHVRMFDSFEIGNVDLTSALPGWGKRREADERVRVIRHASHPNLSTQVLVVERSAASTLSKLSSTAGHVDRTLHLITLDLGFLQSTSSTRGGRSGGPTTSFNPLPVLATKATQLANLHRYLAQLQSQLAREIRIAFELPLRFLGNVHETLGGKRMESNEREESLEEKVQRGRQLFEAEITKMVVTGECGAEMREWLVDEVGERGIKRWEKSVGEGLENVRRGIAECTIPALDRCLVVLSRLIGLAESGSGGGFGLDERRLRAVQATVDCAVLVANDALKVVGDEIKGFRKWIGWLRFAAEVEGCETDERKEEIRESGAESVDWSGVLAYARGGLGAGRLEGLLGTVDDTVGPGSRMWDEARYYDEFKAARRASKGVPGLGELVGRMGRQCQGVSEGIAENLRKSVLVGYLSQLPEMCDGDSMDLRLIENKESGFEIRVVNGDNHRRGGITLDTFDVQEKKGGANKTAANYQQRLEVTGSEMILSIKFMEDKTMLVLVTDAEGESSKLFGSTEDTSKGVDWKLRHVFNGQGQKMMSHMELNGRKGRGVVCVLEDGGGRYEVLDLESPEGEEETEADEAVLTVDE